MAKEIDSPVRKVIIEFISSIVLSGRDIIAFELYEWAKNTPCYTMSSKTCELLNRTFTLNQENINILYDVCVTCLGCDEEGFSFSISDY